MCSFIAAILCGANGKLADPNNINNSVVYFGNLRHSSGAIVHQGDNLTGAGDGDDEQIMVNISQMPANVDKVVFVVNIYQARQKNQHFGMIRNAFIRLVNMDTRSEICRFNLSESYNNMTGLVVGEIYRKNGEWKFNAIGQPVQEASDLNSIVNMYR
ncbi:TerD family protein [Hominisplanchenecus murintestinalis]|uniref:TerD family protein n=1 Tax=Hominisplanchenecus murintestinalis TaxID=2941517 RepID=A0AC61QVK5_9FIRM|nr:TerD family protein [Hominisplanchenecus murintestinalis]